MICDQDREIVYIHRDFQTMTQKRECASKCASEMMMSDDYLYEGINKNREFIYTQRGNTKQTSYGGKYKDDDRKLLDNSAK